MAPLASRHIRVGVLTRLALRYHQDVMGLPSVARR